MLRTTELPTSRSGFLSLTVGDITWHNPYDPIRESLRFFNGLSLKHGDIIFQFGWALGYGSEALRSRYKPSSRILIFEPEAELLNLARNRFRDDPPWTDTRFRFISGDQVCRFFSHTPPFACQETDKMLWMEWPAALSHLERVL